MHEAADFLQDLGNTIGFEIRNMLARYAAAQVPSVDIHWNDPVSNRETQVHAGMIDI